MEINKQIKELQEQLCRSFCADIKIIHKEENIIIETPFSFPDGDLYQIYLKPLSLGRFRISDGGHTLIHLSYENEIDKFKQGNRNTLLENIKNEMNLQLEDGEFFIDCTSDKIATNIFIFGQALTKIWDISFLNRVRVQNTFYEDLDEKIKKIVPQKIQEIQKDYIFDKLENAEDYPIDYSINTKKENDYRFIFAVGNSDKAQSVTITLERLLRTKEKKGFYLSSLVVCDDLNAISRQKVKRLSNAAGDELVLLDEEGHLKRKLKKLVA